MNSPVATFSPASSAPALKPRAIDAVEVVDVEAARGVAAHRQLGDLGRLVGRVVEHLDLEQLARVVDLADRVDQPVRDVHLVVDRQLDGDARQHVERRQRRRHVVLVLHVKIHKVVPVPAVDGQDAQDEEVEDEDERLR